MSTLKLTLFDYGAGNLHSLLKALDISGVEVRVEQDATKLLDGSDAVVLPGVGAFGQAASRLAPARLDLASAIRDGVPVLGICLGMQLFFDASDEGEGEGLGVCSGRVTRLHSPRVPQIGWNTVGWSGAASPLTIAYYANSFVARPTDAAPVIAWSEHDGDRFPAVVQVGNATGVQFHPEKSSAAGLAYIRDFLQRAARLTGRQPLEST